MGGDGYLQNSFRSVLSAFLLLVLVATLAACSPILSTSSPSITPADRAPDSAEPVTEQPGIGGPPMPTTIEMGIEASEASLEFSALSADCGRTEIGSNGVLIPALGQFCIILLKVKNIGDNPAFFDPNAQVLITESGSRNLHNSNAEAFCRGLEIGAPGSTGTYCDKTFDLFLNPGIETAGTLIFDFASATKERQLELHEYSGSLGILVNLPKR